MATTLKDVARVIRSKNAGPFEITFDIMFASEDEYRCVKKSGRLTRETVAALYGVAVSEIVAFVWYDPALAVKFTLTRPVSSGNEGERDTYGAQQHAPLLSLEVE
ncbi:MAG: DUF4387 domain-containing protein [Bacillaceae bacterium]|nr:DUF4387 domain-containing protein [Bacillaceae bacterium]